jgi:hypothetical protein
MSSDSFKLDVVADALATTISRHATARNNDDWPGRGCRPPSDGCAWCGA